MAITQILSTPERIRTRARGALDRAHSAVIGEARRCVPTASERERARTPSIERAREREREREGQSGGRRKARSPSNGRGNGRLAERARRRQSGQRREREDEGLSGHERAFPRPPRMRRASVPVASPCHPTQVIGHPLRRPLRSLVPRRERRCPSSSLPGEWFLLSYGPAPSRRSPPRRTRPSLYLFRFLSGDLFSVATPLSPWPLVRSLSIPPLVSLAPSRHPHRFKRGAVPSAVLSLRHVLSPYASPAHNIHFHHLSRAARRGAARRGAARRFTVRLGGGV